MTHRGPFQPLLFCDSVIPAWAGGTLNPPRRRPKAFGKIRTRLNKCHVSPRARGARRGGDYLREVDGLVFGNAVGVFAGKHPAVAAVHLLRDLL